VDHGDHSRCCWRRDDGQVKGRRSRLRRRANSGRERLDSARARQGGRPISAPWPIRRVVKTENSKDIGGDRRVSNPSKRYFVTWRCRSSFVARVRESHRFLTATLSTRFLRCPLESTQFLERFWRRRAVDLAGAHVPKPRVPIAPAERGVGITARKPRTTGKRRGRKSHSCTLRSGTARPRCTRLHKPLNPQTNRDNCGSCGSGCTSNQACCSGSCLDLQSFCGSCGHDCGHGGMQCVSGVATSSLRRSPHRSVEDDRDPGGFGHGLKKKCPGPK
jgi:hypothetical protein